MNSWRLLDGSWIRGVVDVASNGLTRLCVFRTREKVINETGVCTLKASTCWSLEPCGIYPECIVLEIERRRPWIEQNLALNDDNYRGSAHVHIVSVAVGLSVSGPRSRIRPSFLILFRHSHCVMVSERYALCARYPYVSSLFEFYSLAESYRFRRPARPRLYIAFFSTPGQCR